MCIAASAVKVRKSMWPVVSSGTDLILHDFAKQPRATCCRRQSVANGVVFVHVPFQLMVKNNFFLPFLPPSVGSRLSHCATRRASNQVKSAADKLPAFLMSVLRRGSLSLCGSAVERCERRSSAAPLCSPHISLLASHLCSFHISLHSSHLSTLFTYRLSSHLYSLASLLSSQYLHILKINTTKVSLSKFLCRIRE